MQIKQLGLDGVDIILEDGKAWQGNTVLLSLENVEAVSGYENLQNLKQKRAELESRYYAAKTRHAENPDDSNAYEAFFEASKQRGEAIQEIRDIEEQLYHMMEGMYEQTSHGKLTTRQAEGYRLIERGLLNEARAVLDFDAIVSESRHHEELAEQAAKRAQDSVNELMQLKDVNATLLDWDGVDACYKEAVRLEEKHNLRRDATVLYVEFLILQRRLGDATECGEKLRGYYDSPDSGVSDYDKAFLLNMLGIIYDETQRMEEAEKALKASLELRLKLAAGELDEIQGDIAATYNNLGNMYYFQNRFEESVAEHKRAMEIRKKLAAHDPDRYEKSLAYTYINLGAVYNEDEQRISESVELVSAARDIFHKLAAKKPVPFEEYLSHCYNNLGVSYTKQELYKDAETQFDKALEIQLRLAADNPDAYEPRAAETYIEYGRSRFAAKHYADAIEMYNAAYELYRKLADRNPEAFEEFLADTYSALGELHKETERFAEAETALNSAIGLYDKYAQDNPACSEKSKNARNMHDSVTASRRFASGMYAGLSPEEKKIALLLADGLTRREIIRKLTISAEVYEKHEKAIREKLVLTGEPDPVAAVAAAEYKLTKRETDVLRCLRKNMANDEIAAELFLSEETVRGHVRNLMKKLPENRRDNISEWS
jgi:DNA-binding CsgD family transcriptional regulator